MEIKEILRDLVLYFSSNCKRGHTTAMIEGAKNNIDTLVMAASKQHVNELRKYLPKNMIGNIGNMKNLYGLQKPMVFDNYTLLEIFFRSIKRMEELEKIVAELKDDADETKEIAKT